MRTVVRFPYGTLVIDDRSIELHLDQDPSWVSDLARVEYQLRFATPWGSHHGDCIITTHEPDVMWLPALGTFYRVLISIYGPEKPGYKIEIQQVELKIHYDRIEVMAGWNADTVFPVLATIPIGDSEVDTRSLFENAAT